MTGTYLIENVFLPEEVTIIVGSYIQEHKRLNYENYRKGSPCTSLEKTPAHSPSLSSTLAEPKEVLDYPLLS